MAYYDDPFWQFDPEVAEALRSAFAAEVDRRIRPSEDAAADQALAAEEARIARTYPEYASQRREVLNYAIANGIDNLEQAYQDYDLARQEQWMRSEYPAYDRNRLAILEHAIQNSTDIESAYHEVRKSTEMSDRAAHRATRLQELEHKFSPADELEKDAIKREALEDGEKAFEKTLRAKHREQTRLESIDNSFREQSILNDRARERARAGKVDVDAPPYLDREELDRSAIAQVERANNVDSKWSGIGNDPNVDRSVPPSGSWLGDDPANGG